MTAPVGAMAVGALPRLWKPTALLVAMAISFGACLLGLGASAMTQLPSASVAVSAPGEVAQKAVDFAYQQLGQPYLWGGEGDGGFDCSGLTQAAYASGAISLPRVAQDQYEFGPLLPVSEAPAPGDLVFFGSSPNNVTHVGIAIGNEQMIDAPHAGARVRVESFRWSNYLGSTRPTATR